MLIYKGIRMELKDLSLDELKKLLVAIPVEINRREKAERAQALKDLEALAVARGFTLADLVDGAKHVSKAREPAVAKYRNPEDHSKTWTGRGNRPKWLKTFVARGGKLDDLKI